MNNIYLPLAIVFLGICILVGCFEIGENIEQLSSGVNNGLYRIANSLQDINNSMREGIETISSK